MSEPAAFVIEGDRLFYATRRVRTCSRNGLANYQFMTELKLAFELANYARKYMRV